MYWMINYFPIKAINLLEFSATSHAGTAFPVLDTSSLGGDSAQLLRLEPGFGGLWSIFLQEAPQNNGSMKSNTVGERSGHRSREPVTLVRQCLSLTAAHCLCLDKGRECNNAWAVFLRSILVTFGSQELSWLGISWTEGEIQIFFFLRKENESNGTGRRSVWAHFIGTRPGFQGLCFCLISASQEVTDVGKFPIFTLHPPVSSSLIAKLHWLPEQIHQALISCLAPC